MTRLPRSLLHVLLGGATCVASACDPCSGVAARIEALAAGETYAVPEGCVVREALTIPAGARVEGAQIELEPGESIALSPSPDAARPTVLAGATVRGGNDDAPAVVARGPGRIAIEGATFELARGIAIGVSGGDARLEAVTVRGNLDPARAGEVPQPADPAALATYGVVAIGGATLDASNLAVRGVAVAAVACAGSTMTVRDATLTENLGFGVSADACDLTLEDVEIAGTVSAPLRPGIGIAARASTVEATRLHVHDAAGYGVLATQSDVGLTEPRLTALGQAGVWVESGSTLRVGSGSFEDLGGAGIAAVGAVRLEARDTRVASTRSIPIPTAGGTSLEEMGDGIHVVQLADVDSEVELADVTLVRNERVGLVLDGGMRPLSISIARTRVETTGMQLGALAQNVVALPAGWDASVTRVGSAETLDASAGPLAVSEGGLAGILMPPTIMF